jgi:chromosome segregation ATPase
LVAAYQQGRGARKELRSARKAVKQALDVLGNTLRRWERSSGDFKSTLELSSKDEDARHNAEVVDRSIAKLVDSLQQLQQMAAQMGQKNQDLGQKLKQLRGRIPDEDAPPGAAGEDEEEEEDKPNGQQEGQQEGPTKEGQEIPLTPEQAAALLEGFKLGDKRLPMGMESSKDQKRKGGEEY